MVVIDTFSFLLIGVALIIFIYLCYKLGQWQKEAEWQQKFVQLRGVIADKQRATVKGHVAETFAPYLGDFPFKPSECKFIGDPIDFVVFEGLDTREVRKIYFVDVKTGSSQLSTYQKQIKEAVEKGQVEFQEYRVKV